MSRITTIIFVVATAMTTGCGSRDVSDSQSGARVVFRAEDGRELTADDLANATGTFDYEIVGTNDIPDEASNLHQKARQAGAAGNYEQALRLLAQAQELAPKWPYPTYDTAFTYLLMEDFTKARDYYEKTVNMSPRGFFTSITALDTLDREANGELPQGTYAAYVSLEWLNDPDQKARAISSMVERLPQFAPAWKEYALQVEDLTERLAAIDKGLAANPDAETKGMLLINKALTLNQQGDPKSAVELLGNLALDPNTTFANEHLAKQTLAMVSQ